MDLHAIRLEIPADGNIIVGHSHFIKTVEDIYEAIVNTVPQMKFGIAFNEASGACLTRVDGNDDELKALAARNATAVGAGHMFVVALRGGFPINIKNRIIETPEVCANIAFGGPDLRTLLFTASTSVYTLRVKTPGLPHPWYKVRSASG